MIRSLTAEDVRAYDERARRHEGTPMADFYNRLALRIRKVYQDQGGQLIPEWTEANWKGFADGFEPTDLRLAVSVFVERLTPDQIVEALVHGNKSAAELDAIEEGLRKW